MSVVVFYPMLAEAFNYAGIHERCAPGMLARTLREGNEIACLLDHDPAQLIGTTRDHTLRLTPERDGVRCEVTHLPDTASGRRLATALAEGAVTGCSLGFTIRRARWYVGHEPLRELQDVDLHEVTMLISPRLPANSCTWARVLAPRLRERYERLRTRPGATFHPPAPPPADVTIRVAPLSPQLAPVAKALLGPHHAIAYERRMVEAAVLEHPNASTVDIVYPRPLASLTSGKSPVGSAAGVKPVALPGRPSMGLLPLPMGGRFLGHGHRPSPSPKGATMHDDTLPLLRPAGRREIPGPTGCDGAETLRRLKKYWAQSERRWPGSTRAVEEWKPYVDAHGVWHAGPQDRAMPLLDALKKTLKNLEAQD